MPTETLRDKFIREAEQDVDRKLKTLERLAAETTEVQRQVDEARDLVRLLSQHPEVKSLVADRLAEHDKARKAPPATGTAVKASQMVQPMPEEAPQPHKPKRKSPVRMSDELFLTYADGFLGGFTAEELAEKTKLSQSAVLSKLRKLAETGAVEKTADAVLTPGVSSTPARWRRTATSANGA
jgi:DNA-binding transcriptional ArsR family regulator